MGQVNGGFGPNDGFGGGMPPPHGNNLGPGGFGEEHRNMGQPPGNFGGGSQMGGRYKGGMGGENSLERRLQDNMNDELELVAKVRRCIQSGRALHVSEIHDASIILWGVPYDVNGAVRYREIQLLGNGMVRFTPNARIPDPARKFEIMESH